MRKDISRPRLNVREKGREMEFIDWLILFQPNEVWRWKEGDGVAQVFVCVDSVLFDTNGWTIGMAYACTNTDT